ncbi:MAG TPA: PIG-L family deacetylase [Aggregatilinea sp.]|jgi:LmbE family N-acetylglucosaminyl deacetylase|uniref:PIG-L deacetylase family protein n=1 Tax=Aggregatilinea sp. TaxID=2806333 RepID=UPI002BD95E6D|nr:PIG-L deacetylase family protein [Aggregatilinea sp.]HML21776.1 PIG-L family deacetylase [Aggregatilinea sp.]
MAESTGAPQIQRVMGIFAHPDDPEFFCGGTFARWAAEGKHIIFVMATSGDKGSGDVNMHSDQLIALREAEERAAAARLGVKEVIFLRYLDGELQPTLDLRRQLTRLIRLKRPDTVVASDPSGRWYGTGYLNHPDHLAIAEAALDAVFPSARDHLTFPELYRREGLQPHKVKQVYMCLPTQPTVKIDVTDYLETKIAALREHVSQIGDMDEMARRQREGVDREWIGDGPRYSESFRVFQLD